MCPNKRPLAVKSHSAPFGEALFSTAVLNDTGATQQMTKFKDYFIKYTAFDEPKMITLGNKQAMIAYGRGDIDVETLADGAWKLHTLNVRMV